MKRPANEEDAKKLKRIRVWDRIKIPDTMDFDFEGPVLEVAERITKLNIYASIKGWKEIRIVQEGNYDDTWYELHGTRLETDKEMRKRFDHVRRMRVRFPKKKK